MLKSKRAKYWAITLNGDNVDVTYYNNKKALQDYYNVLQLQEKEDKELLMVIKGKLIKEGNRVNIE